MDRVDLDDLHGRARELREGAGISRNAMARFIGLSASNLARWEDQRTAVPGAGNPRAAVRWRAALRLLAATEPPAAAWPARPLMSS